jgi:predicted enzyme related to lactoylglutathione lyase
MPGMSIRTSPWPAGVPCWVDIGAPDVEASCAFYSSVLGWTVSPAQEDDEFGGYRIALVDGQAVAGLGPLQPGQHTAWTVYLASDDADATATSITEHGGQVLVTPMDVGPAGRMAIAQDPTGAVFGLWQAGDMIGAGLVNEPGSLAWEDLRSTDPAAAQDFYRKVFGYTLTPLEMAGPDYGMFSLPGDEAPLGGMGGMMGGPEGVPSHWLAYFAVVDADAAVAAAQSAGGRVIVPPFDTEFGRMGGVMDPDGAVFWVAQAPEGAQQRDWSS